MSREIGSDQTTEQRLVHFALLLLSFPAYCMPVHQGMHVGGVAFRYRTATGFAVGRSAVC
jgi:hypothetical protein